MNKRNMAVAEPIRIQSGTAEWTNWTTAKAVKEGYKVSGWVYRAISLISRNGSSVPWFVYDNGEKLEGHPLSKMLAKPNPVFSRVDIFELLISWGQLSGESYLKMIKSGNHTVEIWPISPDRLAPIPSKDAGKLIDGYEFTDKNGTKRKSEEFTEENIIHFRLLDPSNPLHGIGPLQAAAKAVDADNEQANWNKSAMQNRGVLDGIFSFDRDLDPATFDAIRQKLKEMFGGSRNARAPGVIGSNAKYQQLSITPAEMDFLNSRKFNREEIATIFGIPAQLLGSQESSTYNNFTAAMRILWELTLIPMLDDLADSFNLHLASELGSGLRICYDLSGVSALRESEIEKGEIAKVYFDMGIPVSILNDKFKMGVTEYEGWDKPFSGTKSPTGAPAEARKKKDWILIANRDIDAEIEKAGELGDSAQKVFKKLLDAQQEAVFSALDSDSDVSIAIQETHADWVGAMKLMASNTGLEMGKTIVMRSDNGMETREAATLYEELLRLAIESFINEQGIILTDISLIESFTTQSILEQVLDGNAEGKSIADIKQAILDSGIFSPERALRIARTESATFASSGQLAAGKMAGATHKIWHESGSNVRKQHKARSGETVGIDDFFSAQYVGSPPMFPSDPRSNVADRVNCRCAMTFKMS